MCSYMCLFDSLPDCKRKSQRSYYLNIVKTCYSSTDKQLWIESVHNEGIFFIIAFGPWINETSIWIEYDDTFMKIISM